MPGLRSGILDRMTDQPPLRDQLPTIRRALNISDEASLLFCPAHNIWSTWPCPACQTQWADSPAGLPCGSCARCQCREPYGDGCRHACEPPICHPSQDCLHMAAGEGHHV